VLGNYKDNARRPKTFLKNIGAAIKSKGGVEELTQICEQVIACHSSHHHPLLWTYFKSRRSALFNVAGAIQWGSSTQNDHLMCALKFLMVNRHKRSETLTASPDLNLSFISGIWQQLVYEGGP
jgi:hypothetical protein